MSIEAFKAAADPNRFPEHLTEGLRPWQVKKLYLSVRESEQIATLKIDVGAYDPLVGKSYREIARDGLSHQRSQGAGQAHAAPGSSLSGVMLADSAIPKVENEKSIFDGIDTTILGIAKLTGSTNFSPELTEISNRVEAAISKFDALKPWVVVSDLAAGTKATRALIVLFLLGNKAQEFNDAMNKALGLVMEALVDPERASGGPASFFALRETFNVAIPGQRFSLTLSVTNRSPVQLEKGEADIARTQGWEVTEKTPAGALPVNNSTLRAQFEAKVPDNAEYTRPHWSRANEWRDYIYQINKPQYLHLPFAPPEIFGVFSYEVAGVRFLLSRPVQTVSIARPWGEQRRLLTVAPAINIAISPRVGVVPIAAAQTAVNVSVNVSNNVKGDAAGKVQLRLPDGWTAMPAEHNFTFTHEGEASAFSFKVSLPPWPNTADTNIRRGTGSSRTVIWSRATFIALRQWTCAALM